MTEIKLCLRSVANSGFNILVNTLIALEYPFGVSKYL